MFIVYFECDHGLDERTSTEVVHNPLGTQSLKENRSEGECTPSLAVPLRSIMSLVPDSSGPLLFFIVPTTGTDLTKDQETRVRDRGILPSAIHTCIDLVSRAYSPVYNKCHRDILGNLHLTW